MNRICTILGASLVKAMGFQNVDDFLTDPSQIPPKQKAHLQNNRTQMMETQVKQKELEIKAAENFR